MIRRIVCNLRRIRYMIQALFIGKDKKNILTKRVTVINPRNACIIQVILSGKKMGISKRSKRDPLVNAIRKEWKNRVRKSFNRLYYTIKTISVRYARRKNFFQTHTPFIKSGLSNNMFLVYFIVILCKFSIVHHYSPP